MKSWRACLEQIGFKRWRYEKVRIEKVLLGRDIRALKPCSPSPFPFSLYCVSLLLGLTNSFAICIAWRIEP